MTGTIDPAGAPAAGIGGLVDRFDDTVDSAFEHLRGRGPIDATAAVLSNLADYGIVWSLIAAVKSRRRGPGRRRATRALSVAGVSSMTVNTAIKRVVARQRPAPAERGGPEGLRVRAPSSSSFPSGHTLAAFTTAMVLADTPAERTVYLSFATAVAASRIYLRAHHASDVVGGAVIGTVLGVICRGVLRRR